MNTFFKQLAETLKDRQELRLTAKKIEGELVLIIAPDFQKEGTNIHMTGSPEELDENFFVELKKPLETKVEFQSNAGEVAAEEEEENKPTKETQPSGKKAAAKKAPTKAAKKVEKEVVHNEVLPEEISPSKPITEPVIEVGEETTEEEPKPTTEDDIVGKSGMTFNECMDLGKTMFAHRKYKEAEQAYSLAVELQPENKKAIEARDNATKWVKAVANLGI